MCSVCGIEIAIIMDAIALSGLGRKTGDNA